MRVLLVLPLLFLLGCATAHEYCVSNSDRYASYDQCYAERTRKMEAVRNAFANKPERIEVEIEKKPVNCQTQVLGDFVNTQCY